MHEPPSKQEISPAPTLEHLLALRRYCDFVRHIGTAERISIAVPECNVALVARMFRALHTQLGERWRAPSPELESRMLDYLVELSVLRPAYP